MDIDGGLEDTVDTGKSLHTGVNGDIDEESAWADEEPDEDFKDWKLKLVMEEDDGL